MEFKELQDVIDKHTFTVFNTETKEVLTSIIALSDTVEEITTSIIFELTHTNYVHREDSRKRAYIALAMGEIFYDLIEVLKNNTTSARGKLFITVLTDTFMGENHSMSAIYWVNQLINNHANMTEEDINQSVQKILFHDGHTRGKALLSRLEDVLPTVSFE